MTRRVWLPIPWRIALIFAVAVCATSFTAIAVALHLTETDGSARLRTAAFAWNAADDDSLERAASMADPQQAVQRHLDEQTGLSPNTLSLVDLGGPAYAVVFAAASLPAVDADVPTTPGRLGWADLPRRMRESLHTIAPVDVTTTIRGASYFMTVSRVPGSAAHGELFVVRAFSRVRLLADVHRLRSDLAVVAAVAAIASVLLGLGLGLALSRPLAVTTRAVRRLRAGDLDTRVDVRGRSELADLGAAFNDMAGRLSATVRELTESQSVQRRFVADVSHELRTPLAAMLAAGDGLASADPHTRDRSAALLQTQTRRLSTMVEDLLELSRFDAGRAELRREPTDLVALARDAAHTVAPDAEVSVTGQGDPTVAVDPARLHAVLRNLIGNAVQHGAAPVEVRVSREGTDALLRVHDHGPGIDPRIADTLFHRFVRADDARSSADRSTGLGLAIARENVELHGGTITLDPQAPTTFRVRLPAPPDGAEPDTDG